MTYDEYVVKAQKRYEELVLTDPLRVVLEGEDSDVPVMSKESFDRNAYVLNRTFSRLAEKLGVKSEYCALEKKPLFVSTRIKGAGEINEAVAESLVRFKTSFENRICFDTVFDGGNGLSAPHSINECLRYIDVDNFVQSVANQMGVGERWSKCSDDYHLNDMTKVDIWTGEDRQSENHLKVVTMPSIKYKMMEAIGSIMKENRYLCDRKPLPSVDYGATYVHFDKNIPRSYEFVAGKDGSVHVHGNAVVNGSTREVCFSTKYDGLDLTVKNVKSLLSSGKAFIYDEPRAHSSDSCSFWDSWVNVELGSYEVNGRKCFGIKRVDQNRFGVERVNSGGERRLPDVADKMQGEMEDQIQV